MARETTLIQMYTTIQGDAAATIDIPDNGVLLGIVLGIEGLLNADAESAIVSVEFGAANTHAVNDTRGMIAALAVRAGLLTSGGLTASASQHFEFGEGLTLFGGERIYMHTAATGGTLSRARALLICRFDKFIARRR